MKNIYHFSLVGHDGLPVSLLRIVYIAILLAGGMATLSQNAAADDTPTPSAAWLDRNSPESTDAVAHQFLDLLVLDPEQMKLNNLSNRPAMAEIAQLYHDGKFTEGMNRYFTLFYDKLRHPASYGICPSDIDPASEGVANLGGYPPIMLPEMTSRHDAWIDESAVKAKTDAAMIANADQLMKNMVSIGGTLTDVGEPGSVNWKLAKPSDWVAKHPDNFIPDANLLSGMAFSDLLGAYILTHDKKYADKWAAFMDDWYLNCHYVDGVEPCFVPDGVSNTSAMATAMLTRLFAGLAAVTKPGEESIPQRTLAQLLMKRFNEYTLQGVVYIRSNTHNWTPSACSMSIALFYDEFKMAPMLFREARRRHIEDNAVTQNLRDGTENQEDPWYNGNYLSVGAAFPLLAARATLPDNQELPWVAELRNDPNWQKEVQDHIDEHLNYRVHLRTGQGQWPIPFRGGDNRTASIADKNGDFESLSPKEAADPTNKAILAATAPAPHQPRGPGPSYTADWFPYAGYNTVRDG